MPVLWYLLFWDVTQCRLVVTLPQFWGQCVVPKCQEPTTNLCYVTFKKSKDPKVKVFRYKSGVALGVPGG
jgi:hypothetical protein